MGFWGGSDDFGIGGMDNQFDPSMFGGGSGNTMEIPPMVSPSYPVASPPGPMPSAMPGPVASPSPVFSSDMSGSGGYPPSSMSGIDPTLLKSLFSGSAAAAPSTPSNPLDSLSSLFGGGSSGPLSGLFDMFGKPGTGSSAGPWADTFGDLGTTANDALAGSKFGPWGALAGAALGDITSTFGDIRSGRTGEGVGRILGTLLGSPILGAFLGDMFAPAGLPKFAKPQGFVNALEGSGSQIESMLGQYIQKYGIGKGLDLSEGHPTPGFQPTAMANILEALTGQQMPDLHGTTLTPKGQTGYEHPVGLAVQPLNVLRGLLPNMQNLSLSQVHQIWPQIQQLLLHRFSNGGGKLQGLLENTNTLATKLANAETY